MRKFDPGKLTMEQLEAAAAELRNRREEIAAKAGVSLTATDSDCAMHPSAEFETPYGTLTLSQVEPGGICTPFLNGIEFSYSESFPERDDSSDADTELLQEVDEILAILCQDPSWSCMNFVKRHEELLKAAMVGEVQEG